MIRSRFFSLHFSLLALSYIAGATAIAAQEPVAVRNDIPRMGQQEVIMMRHAYIEKGGYGPWYEASRNAVWPWYERLGTRILGDFQIIYPEGDSETPELDEALRFARYASYEHWQATRDGLDSSETRGSVALAGNGGLHVAMAEGIAARGQVAKGSKGGVFLRGHMHETHSIYIPGTGERFEHTSGGLPDPDASGPIAVRLDRAQPSEEILVLEYAKVRKRSFEEVHALTREGVWP